MRSRILRFIKLFLFSIGGFMLVYLLLAVVLSYTGTRPQNAECDQQSEIYVASNGIHLYILLPVENINEPLLRKLPVDQRISYFSFGWGDKEFYINTPEWSDLTLGTAVRALFTKSETAMHVTVYRRKRHDIWNKVELCPDQLEALNNFIYSSFRTSNGDFIPILTTKYTADDYFFGAEGNYSLIKTSNVWVNQALKAAGVKTSVWSPFDFGVLHHLDGK